MQQLVEQAKWILSNGVVLADSRQAETAEFDLGELITQTLAARPASIEPPVDLTLDPDLPLIHLDPGFARALIENILGLFRQLATATCPLQIRTSASGSGVEIDLFTAAPGYRSLTSLPPGSSLSIDCARRIAAIHGGSSAIDVDPLLGIRLRVMLP